MTISDGDAVMNGARFSSGVIEFDLKPLDEGISGIRFRRRDSETAELVYVRAGADCRASNDCIQYAPINHGLMQWDLYPRFQSAAPLLERGWNHIRLQVAGRRLRVFVNEQATPALDVDRLRSGALEGGLELTGPAAYANLKIDDAPASPPPAPPVHLSGVVRDWRMSTAAPAPAGDAPNAADAPPGPAWRAAPTEDDGLVNLSRLLGSPTAPTPAVAWLRTTIVSDQDRSVPVLVGWIRQLSVFVDGARVFQGDNPYSPETARRFPDGRIADLKLELPLKKGTNVILLAVGDRWLTKASRYGWGARMRLLDTEGVRVLPAK